jgi:hypothetical protein
MLFELTLHLLNHVDQCDFLVQNHSLYKYFWHINVKNIKI